jgi:hypothetical protein
MRILATIAALIFMAACSPTAGTCDGWKVLRYKRATAAYIIRNDTDFAAGVLGHNEFGERACKWKP